MSARPEFEGLLERALAPVEPPPALCDRVERRLTGLTEMAAEELDAWELAAMRDPRNWVRPAAAVAVGTAAGAALVLVRARQRQRARRRGAGAWDELLTRAGGSAREFAADARKLLRRPGDSR